MQQSRLIRTRREGGTPSKPIARDNIELAKAAYAAINRADLDAFLALVDPEVEFMSLIAEAEGQVYRGHAGVRQWWSGVAKSLGGLVFEPEEMRDFGDRGLVVRIRVTGSVGGVEVPQTMWQALKAREGRPYWWRTVRTEREALEALGAADVPPAAST